MFRPGSREEIHEEIEHGPAKASSQVSWRPRNCRAGRVQTVPQLTVIPPQLADMLLKFAQGVIYLVELCTTPQSARGLANPRILGSSRLLKPDAQRDQVGHVAPFRHDYRKSERSYAARQQVYISVCLWIPACMLKIG